MRGDLSQGALYRAVLGRQNNPTWHRRSSTSLVSHYVAHRVGLSSSQSFPSRDILPIAADEINSEVNASVSISSPTQPDS